MRVFIIAAISADGLMGAHDTQRSLDWRSKDDARFFIDTTKAARVMVMGSTTYKTFRMKRAPPGRRLIVYTRDPSSINGEGVETTQLEPKDLLAQLEKEGYTELAVCGGAMINSLFLEAGVVDEIYLTVEPVVFGGGVPLLRQDAPVKLRLIDARNLSANTLLLHYTVEN